MRCGRLLAVLGLLALLAFPSPSFGRQGARGLKLSLVSAAAPRAADARLSRLAALFVAAGSPPSPFLPAGSFEARFDGFVELELNDYFVFEVHGRGGVTLRINGSTLFAGELTESGPQIASAEIDLRKGANPIELFYGSPQTGAAELRLYWRNDAVHLEPVPPEVLSHDPDDQDLDRGAERRRGRELFASGRCHRCHSPERPIDPDWMPELGATAPSLTLIGERLREGWIRDWLEAPAGSRPGAEMPAVLQGDGEIVRQQAADLAAFLAARGRPGREPRRPFRRSDPESGSRLYRDLGCFNCHPPAGSWDLGHLRSKWHPQALVTYLQQPSQHQPFARMPDFALEREEAEAIAAHLWATSEGPSGAEQAGGDRDAGRELYAAFSCDACHQLQHAGPGPAAPLAELGRLAARVVAGEAPPPADGCLSAGAAPGPSPRYAHGDSDRRALWRFLANDLESLYRLSPPEAAARFYRRLRCSACHLRDGAGDLWSARRESSRLHAQERVSAESDIHDARPPLTWAGEKLRPEWLKALLAGELSYKPRPHLRARMPAFPSYARLLAVGLASEHGLPPKSQPLVSLDPPLADIGRQLVQVDQLGCVACHGLGEVPALATEAQQETINFRYVPDRLRRAFYERFLLDPQRILPGSMMPTFVDEEGRSPITDLLGGDAPRQFDAIWHLMRSLAIEGR